MLQNLSSLDIHKYCYTQYIREAAIVAAEKASMKRCSMSRRGSLEGRTFDFSTLCFFCGNSATNSTSKVVVRQVKSNDVRGRVIQQLLERPSDDEFNRNLYRRLNGIEDLAAANARYHSIARVT